MTYHNTDRSDYSQLPDSAPAFRAYEDIGSTRFWPDVQGNYMPHDQSIEAYSPFGFQPLSQAGPLASQVDSYRSKPTLSINSRDPCSSQLASNSFVDDSTYWTLTGSHPAISSSGTGLGFSDAPYISSDPTRLAILPGNDSQFTPLATETGYTQSTSRTGEQSADPMQDLVQWRYDADIPPQRKSKKRVIRASSDDEQEDLREPKRVNTSASYLIGANIEQEVKLQQQLSDWEKKDRLPQEKELRAIATLTQLPFYKVAMWYGDRLRLTPKTVQPLPTLSVPSNPDATVLGDIAKYIRNALRKICSTAHSRKGNGGIYLCTWSCGYSTNQRDAWIRHEEKRQPQKFWHCIGCRTARENGDRQDAFIIHRPDKFLPHGEKCHPSENPYELRARSKVPYVAPFRQACKLCENTFMSWKERNEHYFQHFEERSHDEPLDLPGDSDSSDGDDDDSEDSDGGNDEGRDLPTRFAGPTSASFPGGSAASTSHIRSSNNNANGNYNTRGGGPSNESQASLANLLTTESMDCSDTDILELCESFDRGELTERKLAAHWLIQVEDYRIIEAHPDSRYLALKYSSPQGAMSGCLESSQGRPPPKLPSFRKLPAVFQKAFGFAKDMGFQHLWIDLFCGVKKAMGGADSVYRQANLILVIGHPSQDTDEIWHFTCGYRHLSTVQSWAKQTVSFHHLQQLGHGAYSVVDKVELRPTRQTFARKIVFRTKRTPKGHHVEEIEIMKKLRHPHIARFVAAYYEHGALNILMSPVADCDLRKYLACPARFPEKRQYLPGWFMCLAEALAYIHWRQCRHKDIKPANVLISGSKVLLTDFGTSLDFSTSQSTSTGGALMTPKYCAPEVAARGRRGRSADVFSLGCVFAEMITVDVGKSLEDLHSWLHIEEESTDPRATYHAHLSALIAWLDTLRSMQLSSSQKSVLRSCVGMLDEHSEQRPSALEVTKALCSKESCHGLERKATCRCCPRKTQRIYADTGMDSAENCFPLSKAMRSLAPPVQQRMRLSVVFTYSPLVLGKIGKSCGSPVVFTLLLVHFAPASLNGSLQVQTGCGSQSEVALLPWFFKAWWRGVDEIPPKVCKPATIDPICDNIRAGPTQVEQANQTGRVFALGCWDEWF